MPKLVGTGDLYFAATGVTGSELVDGMIRDEQQMTLHTIGIARRSGETKVQRSAHSGPLPLVG